MNTKATASTGLGDASESACCHTLSQGSDNVTSTTVPTVQLGLVKIHRQLVSILDLLPISLVLLLSQLLSWVQKAVEHARDLEKEHVKRGLHSDLNHERVRRLIVV